MDIEGKGITNRGNGQSKHPKEYGLCVLGKAEDMKLNGADERESRRVQEVKSEREWRVRSPGFVSVGYFNDFGFCSE